MSRILILLALLLVCSAAIPSLCYAGVRDWRDCAVESAEARGRGYRVGGGYVASVSHVLCNDGSCALVAEVNGYPAKVIARGATDTRDSSEDDGCDWSLLYCAKYKDDPWCEIAPPTEGAAITYRGKSATVGSVSSSGYASIDGDPMVAGDSGSGVVAAGVLVGLMTTYIDYCTCGDCPAGYFCIIGPEILAAVEQARAE